MVLFLPFEMTAHQHEFLHGVIAFFANNIYILSTCFRWLIIIILPKQSSSYLCTKIWSENSSPIKLYPETPELLFQISKITFEF